MIALALAAAPTPSPTESLFRTALCDLDFVRGRYRLGDQETSVLTDLPGLHFERSHAAQASRADGTLADFSINEPRLTDLGLYIGSTDICRLDLDAPLAAFTIYAEFDRSGWQAGAGYRRAFTLANRSAPDQEAALYNDNVTDNVVRYRIHKEGSNLFGPQNLIATQQNVRMVMASGPNGAWIRNAEAAAETGAAIEAEFDRVWIGAGTIGLNPLLSSLRRIGIWSEFGVDVSSH